jgi:hypothetical protein
MTPALPSPAGVPGLLLEFTRMSARALPSMLIREGPDAGLHCFKLRLDPGGALEQVGASTTYSLMAWLGLFAAGGKAAAEASTWALARRRLEELLAHEPSRFSLADLGLLLWLAGVAELPWQERAGAILERRWRAVGRYSDTAALAWLLIGLSRHPGLGDLGRQVRNRLLQCFNPATQLFSFEPFKNRGYYFRRGYRHALGSFASQIYPILALSLALEERPEETVREMVTGCADRLCRLQGPRGEWWWIYDARTAAVALEYPVYSVHQDAMAPMALLAAMRAWKRDWLAAVERGLRFLFDYREPRSGDGFLDPASGLIWRAVIRDLPGDPSDRIFGISPADMDWLMKGGRPGWFPRRPPLPASPYRILKEARPYCPGWILFAYAQACALEGRRPELPDSIFA